MADGSRKKHTVSFDNKNSDGKLNGNCGGVGWRPSTE